ncbi:MAG TPA: hypothetical protein VFU19_06950 [Iamia sp.]|nr:hypothetical protein [Iamia sp.]
MATAASPLPSVAAAPLGRQRPSAPVSADGLQASDGQRTLRVSQSQGLPAGGGQVGVAGSGYDVDKGIYVALCVVTPPDSPPSPCGGGIDQTGATGASAWVSSNPPSYGAGLATPYGPGGTFSVNVTVAPVIADGFDCRQIQCAIVTRNDHTRTADRTQDIFVPVTFSAGEAPPPVTSPPATTPTTTAPPTTLAPPPAPTTTAPAPAPETEVSEDGLTGRVGDRSITLSAAADLDPEGEVLTVEGAGFDTTKAVQVTLCKAAASATEAPAPCLAGSTPEASQVVAPEGADGDFTTFGADGSFTVELEVAAVIDGETDCREVECAVTVRHFGLTDADAEAAAADRTLDIAVPVDFAAETPATTTTTGAEEPEDEEVATAPVRAEGDDDGGSALPIVLGLVVLLAGAAVAAVVVVRSRTSKGATP